MVSKVAEDIEKRERRKKKWRSSLRASGEIGRTPLKLKAVTAPPCDFQTDVETLGEGGANTIPGGWGNAVGDLAARKLGCCFIEVVIRYLHNRSVQASGVPLDQKRSLTHENTRS